ncbi:MAG: ATP-binding cassette domain-containing protein [Deltaproteobacteria bacterium]|nr:ATP-binding cassette domain-containing protein [Deltaproteobacteria bacterium]
MIKVDQISKVFKTHKKDPGLLGSLRSLVKREWVSKVALDKVSLQVEPGEILGLVGANGAGKTTLVKILAGIVHPSSGNASVLGFQPWQRDNEFRRQIALIMGQKAQLWWDLPAADCYLLLREIYRIPKFAYEERLEELVSTLGVRDQLRVPIRSLSLGERMKMELIAALLHQPKVIFLDEPTIGLDITAQRATRNFIRSYSKKYKPAIILTSHYMEDIEELCERIVVIRQGSFVYDGPLKTILEKVACDKIIWAQLPASNGHPAPRPQFQHGEVLSDQDGMLRIKVPRDKVGQTVSELLASTTVLDLDVEEEDISIVIERLIRTGVSA